jgi:hypothetical protein
MRRSRRAYVALAGLLACGALASPSLAPAAQVPISGLGWVFAFNADGRHVMTQLGDNCLDISAGYPWEEDNAKIPFRRAKLFGAPFLPGTGGYDPATGRAKVSGPGAALRFDSFLEHSKATIVSNLGVELAGARTYVTAVVSHGKSRFSATGVRRRIAVVKRSKKREGQFHDSKGKSIPSTWIYARQGTMTILAPLAKAFERDRCKRGRFVSKQTRKIRAGTVLGHLTVQLYPDRAIGTAGSFTLGNSSLWLRVEGADGEPKIAVAPTAGATGTGAVRDEEPALGFPLAAGARATLTCESGSKCVPVAGSSLGLTGGFTLSANGRSATVAGLSAVYSTDARGVNRVDLNGSLDGAPVTVASGPVPGDAYLSDDFAARLATTLGGTEAGGGLGPPATSFTGMLSG